MSERSKASVRATIEVVLAFAVMHVAFRAFKRFTALGQMENDSGLNFSPGVAMLVVAVSLIVMRRRGFAAYGATPRPFFRSINAAFLCLLMLGTLGAIVLACGAPFERPPASPAGALGPMAVNIAATFALLWSLQRFAPFVERTPRVVSLALLISLPVLPILAALVKQRSFGQETLVILWVLGGAGIGEEVFFRGYVQSLLNEAFGRPWRVFGVDFGIGLFGAAALFGMVHVLNTADYFAGVYRFSWWHGLAAGSSLFFGFLRERYGSVAAPAIVHGFGDLAVRLPQLIQELA
jgi:CAAX protease family protein